MTGTNEKKINLEIARKVRKELEERGYQVVMTREDDNGLYTDSDSNKKTADMKKRCRMAEESNADILVSIHQNSYEDPEIHGAQVFYYSHSREGEAVAKILQESLQEIDPENHRQAKANETYYLLRRTKVPTVIVECGFLSNEKEAALLVTDAYQQKAAESICHGIQKYFAVKM